LILWLRECHWSVVWRRRDSKDLPCPRMPLITEDFL
jgi:hypothetical protein